MTTPPLCDFRGPVSGNRCRCRSPRVQPAPDGLVPLTLCRICPQRVVDGVPIAPPAMPPPQPVRLDPGPCIHRGPIVREERCRLCGDRERIEPVHACALHGTCSLRRYAVGQPEPVCLRCDDATPPD